jgi:hypothetical protein
MRSAVFTAGRGSPHFSIAMVPKAIMPTQKATARREKVPVI